MKNDRGLIRMQIVFALSLFLLFSGGLVILYAGQAVSSFYFLGFPGLAVPVYICWCTYKRIRFLKLIHELRAKWGKETDRERNFAEMERLFEFFRPSGKDRHVINKQTWEDLDMSGTYGKLDRTLTTPGEQLLYNMLRTPLLSEAVFNERKEIINAMQQNTALREQVQVALGMLGRQKVNFVTDLLWDNAKYQSAYSLFYTVMFIVALAALSSIRIIGIEALVTVVLPVFIVNYFLHSHAAKVYQGQLPTIRYLYSLILSARELGKINHPELKNYSGRLQEAAKKCAGLSKKIRVIGLDSIDTIGIYIYVNVLFLVDARSFGSVLRKLETVREELQEIYILVGELDALISVASFRAGLPSFAEPELVRAGPLLNARDIRHPVIENAVPNSIALNGTGAIITGSNMSGKSTFLRTVGVNALLAQSICTCFAASYTGSYFKILSSISKADSLREGKSYYLAEAESLLEMINSLDEKVPSLFLIDEIFRGTNSLERINAAIEFLDYLLRCNSLTIVASHDLEIARNFAGDYQLFYFSEAMGRAGLVFDYTLKKGVANTWNAVRLLEYLGYPQQIVAGATRRVEAITRQIEG